jgi:pimeloyl-ACP methyl ester carboxylesterase
MSVAFPLIESWRRAGQRLTLEGSQPGHVETVFAIDHGPRDAPAIVILHGFPSSTFDWRYVVDDLTADHHVVGHDFLGFGLSDKPVDADYSLITQADRTERVLGGLDVGQAVIVAHDLGNTVAAELLHRHHEGMLSFDVVGCVLTNGSIFIDLAQLSAGQQALLALPDEPLAESLGPELLRAGVAATFPPEFSADDELDAINAIVALVEHGGGDLLLPRLIRYIEERRRNQPRWTSGLVDAAVPMAAVWGELDPIAVTPMVDRLEILRRTAGNDLDVVRWPDCGHWPAIERPGELAALIRDWTSRWWPDD